MSAIGYFTKMLKKHKESLKHAKDKNQKENIEDKIKYTEEAINALRLKEFFIKQNIKDSKGLIEKAKKNRRDK